MAGQRSRGRTFRRGTRRGTSWARVVEDDFTTVAQASKALIITLVLSNPGISETIVRTEGRILVLSDQAAAVERQFGAIGMVVVSDLAIAAGAASIPGPVTDGSDDGWFQWMPFLQEEQGAVVDQAEGIVSMAYTFSSKAARRVEEGFGVAIMVENASTGTGMKVAAAVSMLTVVNT